MKILQGCGCWAGYEINGAIIEQSRWKRQSGTYSSATAPKYV
ncbi:MAG: hypothetical protein WD208_12765 [Dehalococcoidia bacterium]